MGGGDGAFRQTQPAAHRHNISWLDDAHARRRRLPRAPAYALSPDAWIKTREAARFARLELASYEYGYSNIVSCAHSPHCGGDSDWTYVSVELDSGEEAYVMPCLQLYGTGTAWFDDVMLEELS